jgi:hypothetical protein
MGVGAPAALTAILALRRACAEGRKTYRRRFQCANQETRLGHQLRKKSCIKR